jgi:hypothetical protein
MSPLISAEIKNLSNELTASIFRAEDEFCWFHWNIGRFLPHITASGTVRHYVIFTKYSSLEGRAIALVGRPWLPRAYGSASVIHVR